MKRTVFSLRLPLLVLTVCALGVGPAAAATTLSLTVQFVFALAQAKESVLPTGQYAKNPPRLSGAPIALSLRHAKRR